MAATIKPEMSVPLNVPASDTTVVLHAINTTASILSPSICFVKPAMKGQEYLNMPTYCFLIQNKAQDKTILFDAGARKDWWNLSPVNTALINSKVPGIRIDKDVVDILAEGGIQPEHVSSILWSHWHWDHIGDASRFPDGLDIVVGPGFKEHYMPGYPTSTDCPMLDSDFALTIGPYQAHDFFGDGSFYVLNTPGHAQGHISALARTTPTTFVFLGGDICHYGGAYKPNALAPMPEYIPSGSLDTSFLHPCSCRTFLTCHRSIAVGEEKARTTPYYMISDDASSWYSFPDQAQQVVDGMHAFDADPNVMLCIAHDVGLLPVLKFFPNGPINDWKRNGLKEAGQWGFLNELPRDGKPGRPMLVDGLYREGKKLVEAAEVLSRYD
nr:cytochrome p450 monooxygenase mpade [Quercus suber]